MVEFVCSNGVLSSFLLMQSKAQEKVTELLKVNLVVKSKLPPRSGSSLEVVEPHPKKGAIKFF